MNPANGIIGDSVGTELPEMEIPKELLIDEQRKARYSKSKEYAELKKYMEERIAYYQTFLPDGKPVAVATKQERQDAWGVANAVIAEFNAIIGGYEIVAEAVSE